MANRFEARLAIPIRHRRPAALDGNRNRAAAPGSVVTDGVFDQRLEQQQQRGPHGSRRQSTCRRSPRRRRSRLVALAQGDSVGQRHRFAAVLHQRPKQIGQLLQRLFGPPRIAAAAAETLPRLLLNRMRPDAPSAPGAALGQRRRLRGTALVNTPAPAAAVTRDQTSGRNCP